MCGVVAGFSDVSDILSAMSYRGDGRPFRTLRRGGANLGHVRLAIRDLGPGSDQPVDVPNARTSFGFVGELFDLGGVSELDFLTSGVGRSEGLGDFLKSIDGFFAVVTVSDAGVIRAFTDHLGIKPLYYWPSKGLVCSEITPMFEAFPEPKLNNKHLAALVRFGFDHSGETPWEGIYQMPPGSELLMTQEGHHVRKYWDIASEAVQYSQPVLTFKQMFNRAVVSRCNSDLPVSMLLSGGLDSSLIYYTLKRLSRHISAYSYPNGESEFLPPGVEMVEASPPSLCEAVTVMQTPMDLGSLVPQVQLAQALEGKTRVVITGDGADELFGGYTRSRAYDSQYADTFLELPYYHLPRLDRVLMRSTIELRSPFLAPEIVRLALGLPREMRIDKAFLKLCAKGTVPDEIIDRPKHPLKTQAVITGKETYREQLIALFRDSRPRHRVASV